MLELTLSWKPCEVDFKGHKITAEIRPLLSEAFDRVAPYFMQTQNEFAEMTTVEQTRRSIVLQKECAEIFPTHLRNIGGVTVDGAAPTTEMLCTESTFVELSLLLLTEMITMSQLDGESEKN